MVIWMLLLEGLDKLYLDVYIENLGCYSMIVCCMKLNNHRIIWNLCNTLFQNNHLVC